MRNGLFLLVVILMSLMTGCSGCSRSGRRTASESNQSSGTTTTNSRTQQRDPSRERETSTDGEKSTVPIERRGGVDYIEVEVNGLKLPFVFDTGASNICISMAEAMTMWRSGTLTDEDVREIVNIGDATGRVSEARWIVLRTVRIGNRTLHDVDALVIDNVESPLLLGRSALDRFGRISIDNKRGVIILE